MPKIEQQTSLEETKPAEAAASTPEKAAPTKQAVYDDDDLVTVLWKSWGTSGMPHDRVTYFDRHEFKGGIGKVPYKAAKKWKQQGHGIHILPVDAKEIDFMRATGHAPMQDAELESLIRSTPIDKLAAMLGPDNLDKITALMHK